MNKNHNWKIFIFFIIGSFASFSQANTFKDRFSGFSNFNLVSLHNPDYKEAYELTVSQPIDHSNPEHKFDQRVFVGFQSFNAPTLIVTEGYGIDYVFKPGYLNELAIELKTNIVVIEHRFSGKSRPESINWQTLTTRQAAEDYHFVKSLLDTLLTGKWISSGISKGGQAALAYKMLYPKDVVATIVYGTALKDRQTITTDTLLKDLSQTPCGKKIIELQSFMFRNKAELLPHFKLHTSQRKIDFSSLTEESVFEYLLLELPFSFWQNGQVCIEIPDTNSAANILVNYMIKVVPPVFYSKTARIKQEPSFYMFYHELGYYEYNIEPFKNYLIQNDYSNKNFVPSGISLQFDDTYQKSLRSFMQKNTEQNIFFIYGQNDPWALQTTVTKNAFIIKNGSHKSRIKDLTEQQRAEVFNKLSELIR